MPATQIDPRPHAAEAVSHPESANREAAIKLQYDLPPFPNLASQLLAELSSENAEVTKIIELIECEPRVAAKVLQLANSPLYGVSRPITTIAHAVVILGFKSVSQVALALLGGTVFQLDSSKFSELIQTTYAQSLGIATLARSLSDRTGIAEPDEAFLLGVMHDMGKIVLLASVGEPYRKLLAEESTREITPLERLSYGQTHADIGQLCGQHWGLPKLMSRAIGQHHDAIAHAGHGLAETLIAARHFAIKWQIGFEEQAAAQEPLDYSGASSGECLKAFDTIDAKAECIDHFAAIQEVCIG